MIDRGLGPCAALAACLLAALPVWGQVVRLPTVMPPSVPYSATTGHTATTSFTTNMATRPGSPAELPPTPDALPPPDSDRPPDARDGMFQKLIFTHELLLEDGGAGLGIRDLELKTVLALPIPSRRWPLLITPGFAVHYLEGPIAPDLPPRVYDTYAQFRSLGRINPRLGAELAVTLGAFSDFEQSADEAFRVTGHGGLMWEWTPTAKLVLGAAYINTYDADVIPIGGLIWTPRENLVVEAVFPRPKVARRIGRRVLAIDGRERWLYVAGEWGNDTWAIRRAAGFDDEVNYRDWRLLLGYERKAIGRLDYRFEVGYVFSRKLHYRSPTGTVNLGNTFMVRGGMTF